MTFKENVKKYTTAGIIILITVIITLLVIYPPFGRLECEIKGLPGDLSADFVFSANYSLWRVNDLKVVEEISSQNKDLLEEHKKMLEEEALVYDGINYITNKIELNDESLLSTFYINYKKMTKENTKDLDDKLASKSMFVGKLKKKYINNGATCHYKR